MATQDLGALIGIIKKLNFRWEIMEAEQINLIFNHLQDLENRANELRRFL